MTLLRIGVIKVIAYKSCSELFLLVQCRTFTFGPAQSCNLKTFVASAEWRFARLGAHLLMQAHARKITNSSACEVSYKYAAQTTPPHLVGTHASNDQQQLATQEFLTSRGSLYTR